MAISINDFRVAIRIDNSEAKVKFEETREQISKVRDEMKKLEADGKKDSQQYKDLKAQLDKLNTSYAEQRKVVGKTALSYNDLRKGARSLKSQMDNAIPDTKEWKELRAEYMLTRQRMKELEVQARDTKFSLSKVVDGFNRYAAIGASVIASLTGVVMTSRKCVEEFAEMQEAEAQVVKYTGMTKDEVAALNEEFKQMDTRTARDKLNALAGDAGRLGITAKQDVLDFVDAADKINVALGEDLGEDAVKNIGKLAQMFGEDEKLGLRGAMLATGSAINEVAQNSSAAEAYLVGFTARVAGAANQAKVAQGDIIGYASVLDQNMQQQEMAATAFQTLMMKMFQTPATFAKIAGKSVEEFTKLIKNDANEAMLQFLDTLSKKGGLDHLAPMFKEMGLDGVRASGVISTMAGKIDDIRKAQKLANGAYREGTSIINEFNVQNNTVQAGLDKAKKRFTDIRVELGEKLLPVMRYMVSTGSLTVKGVSELITILTKYGSTILTVSLVIAAYTGRLKVLAAAHTIVNAITKVSTLVMGAYKLASIALNDALAGDAIALKRFAVQMASTNVVAKAAAAGTMLYRAAIELLTFRLGGAAKAMKAFWSILNLSPLGVLLSSITAAIGISYKWNKSIRERYDLQGTLNKVEEKAVGIYEKEKDKVKELWDTIHNSNKSLDDRKAAILKLQEIMPEYRAQITEEGKVINESTQKLNALNESLLRNIKLESLRKELFDRYKAIDELEKSPALKDNSLMGSMAREDVRTKLAEERKVLEGLKNEYKELYTQKIRASQPVKTKEKADEVSGGGGGDYDNDKKPWNTRLQAAENAYKQELLLLRQNSDALARTENEYQMDALQKETEYQAKRLAIIKQYQSIDSDKKHQAELGKLESESKTAIYNTLKKSEDNRLALLKEFRDRQLSTVTDGEKKLQLEQADLYASGELQEKDYKNRLQAIEISSLYSRLEIAKEYQDVVSELEFQNGEIKENAVKEAGDNILSLEKQISEKRAEIVRSSANQIQRFNSQFSKMNSLASAQEQLDALKVFYQSQYDLAQKSGLDTTLLTEVYEESKRKIVEKAAEDRASVIQKYELDAAEDTRNLKLEALEEEHRRGLLSEEEYEIAKNQIHNEYLQEKIEGVQQYFEAFSSIMSNVSSAIQGFQDAEINKVTRKYDKQIAAAKKAGKDTTKLEEEKEEAINQVKKKYADKQFAASVLQVTASTAVAAMEAYKAMAGIPVVGPALGAIAAAAAVASGAAQIAVAKQQRDEAKGLKSGGYSDEYVEGYTRSGNPDDVAGVIPVHKNEFVTNHEGVANPHVRQFLDVFDVAQKNGTIRMINTTQILEQVRTRSGKYSGGFTDDAPSPKSFAGTSSPELTPTQRLQIVQLLAENNRLLEVLCNKELVVDPRKVRDSIKKVERLESNVSR